MLVVSKGFHLRPKNLFSTWENPGRIADFCSGSKCTGANIEGSGREGGSVPNIGILLLLLL